VLSTIQDIVKAKKESVDIAVLARTKAQLRDVEIALLAAGYQIQPLHRTCMPAHMDTLLDLLALVEKIVIRLAEEKKINRAKLEQRLIAVAKLSDAEINQKVIAACRRKLMKALLSPTFEGCYIAVRKVYQKLLRASGKFKLNLDIRTELGRWEPLCNQFSNVAELRNYVLELRTRPSVTTSTIHRAKGGEWDHVLVLGLTDGCLPYYREIDRGAEDEERRLFYVSATRPRERLYFFQAPYHHSASGRTYEERSRFVTPKVRKLLDIAPK
jgi:DNA helicase-2/ATP-dependent DNA helicase PcrA